MLTSNSNHQAHFPTANKLTLFAVSHSDSFAQLQELKQFIASCRQKHKNHHNPFPMVSLNRVDTLEQAIRSSAQSNPCGLVIATGFSSETIRNQLSQFDTNTEVRVLSEPKPGTERYHNETASTLESRRLTRVQSIQNGIRKMLLKTIAQDLGEIKVVESQSAVPGYFQLRYLAWKQMGYIPEDSLLNHDKWEIDRFDRFSIPIGLHDQQNQLIACARLVQSFGNDNIPHIKNVNQALKTHQKPNALKAFSLKRKVEQPFDILCEFKGFWDYYRNFIKQNKTVAEVSRIIVHPDKRGLGLAEVLVDSIITVAQQNQIDEVLLACRESLQPLYKKCGFKAVPGLVSGKFLTIPEKSVVMQRSLK